jgi:hypothetical protein
MAGDALFIGWGPVIPGREIKALEVFQETIAYDSKLQQEGQIESFEPVLLAPHGGDLAGFILLRGQREALDRIVSSPEFRRLISRAVAVVTNVGVIEAFTGEALGQQMAVFRESAEELA